jgi:transglutaminase-like putative cysteine protease
MERDQERTASVKQDLKLGMHAGDRYRTVSEASILEMCHLAGWACESGEGSPGRARTREALEHWIALGLGVRRGADGERYFDPCEVLNFLKQAGLDGRDAFWSERLVGTARRLVVDMRNDDPRKFTVELRRTFNTQSLPAGAALRLRMPLPLTSDHLGDLEVHPHAVAAGAHVAVSRGRLEVRTQASDSGEVTIGATTTFTACPRELNGERSQPDLGAPDLRYLRPREGLIVVSDRVAALASSLVGPDADPLMVVRAFWNYCLDHLSQGAVHYDQVDTEAPGDWLLDSGWGDCQLVSALFASMCRARGIPARILGGFYLYRTFSTNHYWAEAWIDGQGWMPFDFSCWDLSRGGQDPAWRDYFFGRIDCRLTNQCLPLDFTGAVGVKIPAAWHIQQSAQPVGVAVGLFDVEGKLVYRDFVAVVG